MPLLALWLACAAPLPASLPPPAEASPALPEPAVVLEPEPGAWKTLEPGLDLGVFSGTLPTPVGDGRIRVLRVDPAHHSLVLRMASAQPQAQAATAKDQAERDGLVAAINASMFQMDHRTSVGLMESHGIVNNPRLGKDNMVLAFDPVDPTDPPVRLIDRTCEDFEALRPRYTTLIQSLRMVSCRGGNTWSDSARIWSHAAVGLDRQGRPLFIHARSPWSTHDFIEQLQRLPIDLDRLQYAEGGPEATLTVHAGGFEASYVGSYETGFWEDDSNTQAWPLPNVIGVVPNQ